MRFGCTGRFRVELVVADLKGEQSAPATAELTVLPGTSAVVAGPDQALNHTCSGAPLTCTTEGDAPVVTAGIATGVKTVGAVAYHWTADPPAAGPLDEHRNVTFSPSPEAASPSVRIEVDQGAMAAIRDDWVVRVAARDDAGPLGEAVARLSVKNRPPVAADPAAAVSVDHVYSAGAYRALAVASRWQDPDGDPLAPSSEPTGSSACPSYALASDGTALISCARAFTGEPDLAGFVATHSVAVRPADPWEPAVSPEVTMVTILDRPVSAASAVVTGNLHCSKGTSQDACYEYDPEIRTLCLVRAKHCAELPVEPAPALADPDGDPLLVIWSGAGFTARTVVCEPPSCTATADPVPAYVGCDRPTGTLTGSFSASDGLTSASATLTFSY